MTLTEREKTLIANALYIMESQCIGDNLYCGIADDLGGTPNPDEIRNLMGKIKNENS